MGRLEVGVACVLAISVAACGEAPEPTIFTDVTSAFVTQDNASPAAHITGERVDMDFAEKPLVPVDFPYAPSENDTEDNSSDNATEIEPSDNSANEDSSTQERWDNFLDDINKRQQHEVVLSRGNGSEQLVDGDYLSSAKFACHNEAAMLSFKFADPKKLSMLIVASDLSFSNPTSIKVTASLDGKLWRELGVFQFDTLDSGSIICGDGEESVGGQVCALDSNTIRYDVFSEFATTEARLVRLSIKSADCESMKMVLNEIEFF